MKIVAVSISQQKGVPKKNISRGLLIEDFGLDGDAHGGKWHRQLSLLAQESIKKMQDLGLKVHPGSFAENITTAGINLPELPIGTKLKLGPEAVVEVTQIGKVCHDRCAIYRLAGDCVMPREGIFVRILQGGTVKPGDPIDILSQGKG
jgi:MOSC domain-containing protein YiiM